MEQFIKPMEKFINHFQKYWCKWLEQFNKKIVLFIKNFQNYWWKCQTIILRRGLCWNYWYQATYQLSCVTHWPKYSNSQIQIVSVKRDQVTIGKIVDNTIPHIINHNLRYRTTVNSIIMIEYSTIFLQKLLW